MATHSSTLAWKIPWMEEPGGLQSMESQRVRHDWATSLSHFSLSCTGEGNGNPLQLFLPEESQGRRSLVGSQRVGHDWSDLAAAAVYKLLIGTSSSDVVTPVNYLMEPQWYQFVQVLVIFIAVSTVKLSFISFLLSILWGDTLRLCSSLDFCSVVLPLLIIIAWINYHGCKMAFNNSVVLSLSFIYIFSISIGSWFFFYSMVYDSTVPDPASGRPPSWLLCPLNISPTFLKHLLLSCTKKIFQALLILTQPVLVLVISLRMFGSF